MGSNGAFGARGAIFIVAMIAMTLLAEAVSGASSLRLTSPSEVGEEVTAEGFVERDLETLRAASEQELRAALAVFVETEVDVPALLGTVRLKAERLVFRPRLPFLPGQRYRIRLSVDSGVREDRFEIPRRDGRPVEVAGVTPEMRSVPENLLRIYLHFDSPMRGGDVYQRIGLFDEAGARVEQAFVETVPELWDRDRRRLTLVLHPGRIKRGLEMRTLQGPALQAGGRFVLRVEAGMVGSDGERLGEDFVRSFEVLKVDRQSPQIDRWRIDLPAVATREPLEVGFDEPLDRELLHRMISVESEAGVPVRGVASPGADGRSWSLQPDRAWMEGIYVVAVHPALEDLAGNRLDRLFDESADGAARDEASHLIRLRVQID